MCPRVGIEEAELALALKTKWITLIIINLSRLNSIDLTGTVFLYRYLILMAHRLVPINDLSARLTRRIGAHVTKVSVLVQIVSTDG